MNWIHPQFRYTDAEHDRYERLGYCLFPRFLTAGAVEHCRGELNRMLERLQPGRSPDEIYSAHQQEPWIFDLATQPSILDMIERQVGPNVVLWSSHLICKPPRTGRAIPWHQDAPYWNVSGNLSGAVWIAFDDIGADNGGMAVLPGWHNKGTLQVRERGTSFFNDEIDPSALPPDPDAVKVQYTFPAGGAATHHVMIPHNSIPNTSDRWRRVLVLRYTAADGVMGDKLYEDYRTGAKFPREFYLVRGQDVLKRSLKRKPIYA
jgi:ectoine hydroxylase-related dioxygenase (phytanoyl-CoA dioxygenase family)